MSESNVRIEGEYLISIYFGERVSIEWTEYFVEKLQYILENNNYS